ncbi:hypothetical protein FQN60_015555 [Etheostoma spectabile]|uniref:FH2 domain-containing protein n=1 Tax=Etheostoma spectabile TaxID=54343 RepID=A0A5J5CQ79_9PERO|nr:hypothetical protein FQN60_015555 [Etheostoma spectabile]
MESTRATLNLYIPISERSFVSPSLSHSRSPAPPFKAPLKHHGGLTSNYKEEGRAETVKHGQADKFDLSNLKETLKVLDDSSEFWPTELFPLCLECQTSISMGNQQGTKIKPNSHGYAECCDALPKSPRLQIPRKRRRRADGLVYTSGLQHNARMTAGTPQAPPKARRLTKLQKTSSPTFEEWDLKENRLNVCTPAAWRKTVMGKERVSSLEERNRSSKKLKPAWTAKLPDAPSANVHRSSSKKRKDLSVKEECALPDSDTDLSEYDNDLYSTYLSPIGKTEGSNSNSQNAQITQEERDMDEEKKAEGVEESTEWRYEEMGKKAAAWRVMGKIEEVEGIIRRVSLTSSDWIKEGSDGKDEPQFVSDGCFGETQEKGCKEDELLLTEELQALGEALSQSLRQVLKMEGAKSESEPFTEAKETFHQPNLVGTTKRPLNLPSYSYHFASTVPHKSSSCSLSPSLSLSAILDVSPRTSGTFEGMSPILSPLCTSSLSSQRSLPLSLTEQSEKVISATTVSGTGNDEKKSRKSEQNQTYRRTSETEDSCDHLLSSDEALQRQEKIWQQEVEESLSFFRSLSHPSRPKHIDFLRITAPEDDIIDSPTSTPLQPEFQEQKVTLKFFKTLSEEENEDIMQEDEERSQSFNVKKHGNMTFEDGVENSRDSLSHVILPNEGEKLTSNSIEHITRREAGSDSDMIDNERNNVNLTEQQSVAVNAENGLEKQSSATNQVQNKMPDGHCDKDNSCSKKGCHISENLLDECALEETLQPNTGWDCVAPVSLKQDDNEEVDQRGTKDYKKVHFREDVTSVSSPDVGFDPEESAKSQSKTKHVEPIVTVEQTGGPSCFTDDNEEERAGAEEDSEEEKRDAFPDFSAQLHHPSSPKDTSNICITSAGNSPPPEGTFTRATFTPGSPTDKPLPALFSGLRVLRKGVVGPEHDTVAQIKPSSQGARRELYPERQGDVKVQKSFLDQISNLLNTEKRGDEKEEREGMDAEGDQDENEIEEGQEDERTDLETKEDAESTKPSLSSAEAAFDAFKAFFTPKPLKKDPAEKVDLEAVRKKIRADKDVLKALFERSSKKTPEKKDSADGKSEASTSGEGEERTPGRLQAVWPPLKEEKVGLKYTEAESALGPHSCNNEHLFVVQEGTVALVENEDNVARLELTLAELQAELSQFGTRQRGECKDVAVSTGDDFLNKSFRTVCIQTDRETFVKIPEDGEGAGRAYTSPQQQKVTPKKLDLASISLSLAGQRDDTLSSPSYDPPSQTLPPPGTIQPPSEQPPAPSQTTNTDSLPLPPPPPCFNKTLWNILEEPDIINASEFEELFAKTTTQTKRKPLSEAYQKKAKARKIIKLLDGKRSQAVGILISSLHLEMKDIQQAVLAVDHSVVDLETIEALYENRAQPEELERIKKHYETPEEEEVKLLDKPEQFLYELSQIPDFAGRARCIIFQSAFIDGIASVQHKLNTVSSVCKALLESDGVTEVMGLVLALGNYMNGGNRTRGQADGFGLEILPKLKDVKSKHSGTEKSIFPLPEPQDVFLAAQVKFDDLNRDLRQLGRDLIRCEKDVQKVCSDSPGKNLQPFKDKMEAFVLSARKEHAEASYLLMTVQKSFQDLVLYFGLKPKSGEKEVTPAHVLMLWFEFCADFKASWKRENKTIYNERLKEAQLSVKRITAEKKVETRKINPNSLKERLRQKEANMSST